MKSIETAYNVILSFAILFGGIYFLFCTDSGREFMELAITGLVLFAIASIGGMFRH